MSAGTAQALAAGHHMIIKVLGCTASWWFICFLWWQKDTHVHDVAAFVNQILNYE